MVQEGHQRTAIEINAELVRLRAGAEWQRAELIRRLSARFEDEEAILQHVLEEDHRKNVQAIQSLEQQAAGWRAPTYPELQTQVDVIRNCVVNCNGSVEDMRFVVLEKLQNLVQFGSSDGFVDAEGLVFSSCIDPNLFSIDSGGPPSEQINKLCDFPPCAAEVAASGDAAAGAIGMAAGQELDGNVGERASQHEILRREATDVERQRPAAMRSESTKARARDVVTAASGRRPFAGVKAAAKRAALAERNKTDAQRRNSGGRVAAGATFGRASSPRAANAPSSYRGREASPAASREGSPAASGRRRGIASPAASRESSPAASGRQRRIASPAASRESSPAAISRQRPTVAPSASRESLSAASGRERRISSPAASRESSPRGTSKQANRSSAGGYDYQARPVQQRGRQLISSEPSANPGESQIDVGQNRASSRTPSPANTRANDGSAGTVPRMRGSGSAGLRRTQSEKTIQRQAALDNAATVAANAAVTAASAAAAAAASAAACSSARGDVRCVSQVEKQHKAEPTAATSKYTRPVWPTTRNRGGGTGEIGGGNVDPPPSRRVVRFSVGESAAPGAEASVTRPGVVRTSSAPAAPTTTLPAAPRPDFRVNTAAQTPDEEASKGARADEVSSVSSDEEESRRSAGPEVPTEGMERVISASTAVPERPDGQASNQDGPKIWDPLSGSGRYLSAPVVVRNHKPPVTHQAPQRVAAAPHTQLAAATQSSPSGTIFELQQRRVFNQGESPRIPAQGSSLRGPVVQTLGGTRTTTSTYGPAAISSPGRGGSGSVSLSTAHGLSVGPPVTVGSLQQPLRQPPLAYTISQPSLSPLHPAHGAVDPRQQRQQERVPDFRQAPWLLRQA